ncbi:HlyC/CorC family transporter [Rhodococcus sp. KBS0724]|jgi:CBS domain containing-hemolysin-like protein|uniref:hemolysin family protein n=1 Tax=Rhodococcus sp. KBS0724 TaxID=1179674 RepID=UPI00110F10BF|nr:hemolysin family protein [Rhodococcus sp. KBS0724]TSD47387.1 HlyC/CorC family transporter [Rhodococcus sp. KBS0724]
MMIALTLLLGVLVVLLISAVTGYFVAQEFAYMAVDRSRLNSLAESGDAGARRTLAVTRRTSFMLSGAQLGITVTGLLVGYVAEPLIGKSLGTMFGGIGVPTAVGLAIGAVLALLFSTLVQMLFGELFPKNLAIARPEPVARWLARSTTIYLKLFGWLIWIFDQASNVLLRALKIEPVHDVEHSASARDLEHIVAESRETGELPPELSTLLDRILDFPTRPVEHAMIPRTHVDTVRVDDPLDEVITRMGTGHSRYPVVGDDSEDIVGVIHLHDVLTMTATSNSTVRSLARPALVLPTTLPLPKALTELTDTENQLACVIDEYGGFAGVITLEDIAEEIVGEITDEHDPDLPFELPSADGPWVVAGGTHLDEVERTISRDLPAGDYETIAGFTIAHYGELPPVGAQIRVELPPDPADLISDDSPPRSSVVIEVLSVDRHVPSSLRIQVDDTPQSADATAKEAK